MTAKKAPAKNAKISPEEVADAIQTFLSGLAALVEEAQESFGPVAKGKPSKPVDEPDDDDEDDIEDDEEQEEDDDEVSSRRAELEGMKIAALRKIVIGLGYDKADVADADDETLVETILAEEFGETGDDEEDAEDEEDDDDESGYTRDDLSDLSLPALRKIAKDEYGMTAADLKGLDTDSIIDAILGEGDDEDEEDGEEEFDGYTRDELEEMSLAELKAIVKEWDLTVKPGSKSPTYIRTILAAQEPGDEDDED